MPIFAPLSKPPDEAGGLEVLVLGGCVVDVVGEEVVDDPLEELEEVELDVEDDDVEVEDTPTVAARTTPSFAAQQVEFTPPQHQLPSLHAPTGTLSVGSPPS